MKFTVAIVTYKRAWALPFSLASIAGQSRKPDEVIIILKPSGDGSEDVIKRFETQLPIRVITQKHGNVVVAYQLAIENADGDIILFIDDDAIAEEKWVEKYQILFTKISSAGGLGGEIFKAYLNGELKK